MAALNRQVVSVPVVRVRILRIQLQSAPELGLRTGPIPTMAHCKAQRRVGFGRIWIDLERFACCRVRLGERLGWRLESMPCQSAVAVGQPGICRGISWIVVD